MAHYHFCLWIIWAVPLYHQNVVWQLWTYLIIQCNIWEIFEEHLLNTEGSLTFRQIFLKILHCYQHIYIYFSLPILVLHFYHIHLCYAHRSQKCLTLSLVFQRKGHNSKYLYDCEKWLPIIKQYLPSNISLFYNLYPNHFQKSIRRAENTPQEEFEAYMG